MGNYSILNSVRKLPMSVAIAVCPLQESVADISAKVWTAVSMVAHRHLVTLDRSHLLQQCSVLFAVNA